MPTGNLIFRGTSPPGLLKTTDRNISTVIGILVYDSFTGPVTSGTRAGVPAGGRDVSDCIVGGGHDGDS